MILNKAGLDRGLARGYIYKTEILDLKAQKTPQLFAPPKPRAGRAPATASGADERPHTIFGQRFPQNIATKVRTVSIKWCVASSIEGKGAPAVCAPQEQGVLLPLQLVQTRGHTPSSGSASPRT